MREFESNLGDYLKEANVDEAEKVDIFYYDNRAKRFQHIFRQCKGGLAMRPSTLVNDNSSFPILRFRFEYEPEMNQRGEETSRELLKIYPIGKKEESVEKYFECRSSAPSLNVIVGGISVVPVPV